MSSRAKNSSVKTSAKRHSKSNKQSYTIIKRKVIRKVLRKSSGQFSKVSRILPQILSHLSSIKTFALQFLRKFHYTNIFRSSAKPVLDDIDENVIIEPTCTDFQQSDLIKDCHSNASEPTQISVQF